MNPLYGIEVTYKSSSYRCKARIIFPKADATEGS